jgi:hypothetical protein
MNLNVAATIVAISALVGYFLMRFLLPEFNYERLLLLGSLALVSLFLKFIDRRWKLKKEAKAA